MIRALGRMSHGGDEMTPVSIDRSARPAEETVYEESVCQEFPGMTAVVASPPMRGLMAFARRAARTNLPVLISGESGTGKEIVARATISRRGAVVRSST